MACDRLLPTKRAFALHANGCRRRHGATTMAVDPEFEQAPDAPALIAGEEAHINRLAETLSRFIDGNISADALDEDLKGPQTLPTGAAPPESNMSSGSSARRSEMLSTSSTRSILTYSELTGKPAGEPIHNRDLTSSKHGTTSRFAPFRDKIDLALAQWMYHSGLSRGKVDRYFSDLRLKDLHRLTSFHNGKTWLQLLEEFNAGIANDRFTEYEIAVGVADGSGTGERYRFGFRDIIGAVRFLLGHPPFRNDLVYAPVRVFADSEDAHSNNHQRVYSEMHTADWWWETQEALPEGATVVPILLSSDKTQLSKLSGDKKAWPVYMSIGNLNHEARRQRKRPAMVLLGLLPIIPHATPELKMDAYHLALGAMTERKQPTLGITSADQTLQHSVAPGRGVSKSSVPTDASVGAFPSLQAYLRITKNRWSLHASFRCNIVRSVMLKRTILNR